MKHSIANQPTTDYISCFLSQLDERLHSLKADVKSALKTTQTLLAQIGESPAVDAMAVAMAAVILSMIL